MALSGTQKTAILFLAMGEKFTSKALKRLDRAEIVAISKAMVGMETIPKKEVEEVLREYHHQLMLSAEMLLGGPEQVRNLLTKNLDSDTAKYILDRLELEAGPVPFQELRNVSPRILSQILRNEHPQTLALIIGHLPAEQGAELIQALPAEIRAEIFIRLAKLEAVAEDMLLEVDKVLQSQLIPMGGKNSKKVGGIQAVAEVLNAVDRATEEEVLSKIEKESSQMAEAIRNTMFVFEDIKNLDDRAVCEVLKEVSNNNLAKALKGASGEVQDKFFSNLSERAVTVIKEDLETMGPLRLSDMEVAQHSIARTVRRLENEGRIIIGRGAGDVFV